MPFDKIDVEKLPDNLFQLIGKDWLLITAGNKEKYNMMTASWGAMGILWGKPIAIVFIRPTRYTYEFMNQQSVFSLNVLPSNLRKVLNLCGSKSGRDINKMKDANLTIQLKHDKIFFEEARLVFLCKKIYFQDLNPMQFLDSDIEKNYSKNDYHRCFVGEIVEVLQKRVT